MENSKIQEMHFLEQNLQNNFLQKQSFQLELTETESSLKELENSGEEIFKIIGQLMIKTEKEKIRKELKEKIKILKLRIKSIENQEKSLSEQLHSIKADFLKKKK
jgi:prefoldin beta subunit